MHKLEKCIKQVARDFMEGMLNFRTERNFQCLLLNYLRNESQARLRSSLREYGDYIELVHSEFPSPARPAQHHDVVVMTNDAVRIFESDYPEPVNVWARKMSFTAAIELKFLNHDPTENDAKKIKADVNKLKRLLRRRKPAKTDLGYFILFIDKECEAERKRWKTILRYLKEATSVWANLRAYFIWGKDRHLIYIQGGNQKTYRYEDAE